MKKRLLHGEDIAQLVDNCEIVITSDMILTSSAMDVIREKGVRIVYDKGRNIQNNHENSQINAKQKQEQNIEAKIEQILKKEFGITDNKIVEKIKKELERRGLINGD